MTQVQKDALQAMANRNIGAVLISGFGWVFPTHVRDDDGKLGEKRVNELAKIILNKYGKS
ncbi:MAG: hypothetical protein KC944_23355 [Candidatus Omnitrophica bacterium]|nr:hypothetical protein [Candidatus Omnitrophota bacterium]